jgi:hypothetical protein
MPNVESKDISIREDGKGAIVFSGIHEHPINSTEELFK